MCQGDFVEAKAIWKTAGRTIAKSHKIVFRFTALFCAGAFVGLVSAREQGVPGLD